MSSCDVRNHMNLWLEGSYVLDCKNWLVTGWIHHCLFLVQNVKKKKLALSWSWRTDRCCEMVYLMATSTFFPLGLDKKYELMNHCKMAKSWGLWDPLCNNIMKPYEDRCLLALPWLPLELCISLSFVFVFVTIVVYSAGYNIDSGWNPKDSLYNFTS